MYPKFRDYFYFNRSERRGVIILLTIILLLIIAKELLYVYAPVSNYQSNRLDSITALVEKEIKRRDSIESLKRAIANNSQEIDSVNIYDFDPNLCYCC